MTNPTKTGASNKGQAIFALCVLGFIANYLHVSLSFGYDFLWGSIFVLIAVWLYGARWGAFVAAASSSFTLILWHHPWAMPIFIAEALFVGIVLRRKSLNILLVDALYWVLIGIPLVWLIYRYLLHFDMTQVRVIILKDAVNGIFNALLASLTITYLHSHKLWNGFSNRTSRHQTTSLANILFNLLVSCVLIPTLVFTVVDGRQAQQRTEMDIRDRLETASVAIASGFEDWRDIRFTSLQALADMMAIGQMKGTPELTDRMALLYKTLPDVQQLTVIDAKDQTVAQYPEKDRFGKAITSPVPTFATLANRTGQGRRIAVSEVLADESSQKSTVTLTVPIFQGQKMSGFLTAMLDLDYISRMLSWNARGKKLDAILVDRYQRVVASTNGSREPGSQYEFAGSAPEPTDGAQTFVWSPQESKMPPVQRYKNSVTIDQVPLPRLPWMLYLHATYAPHQRYLQNVYTFNLAIMLTLSLCALLVAALLSSMLARPLHQLAVVSTNLPGKLLQPTDARPILWPKSSVVEIDSLTRNFKQMGQTLQDQINDIQTARLDLAAESSRLVEAHRLKDDFLAVLSHELRTPLVPILGYASLIATMPLKPDDTTDAAKTIERNAKAQLRLIEDLLDVTGMMSGKLALSLGIANIRVVIRDCIESVKPMAGIKNLNIVAELGEEALQIPGDEVRIRQIIWNILTNAVKFTPAGGTVTVRLTHTDDSAVIEVRDTGAGIDGKFLPYVFDRFRQAEPHLTRSAGGLGLGLFIVKQLAEMHGGTVVVQSSGLGHGALFTLSLPLRSPAKHPPIEPEAVLSVGAGHEKGEEH